MDIGTTARKSVLIAAGALALLLGSCGFLEDLAGRFGGSGGSGAPGAPGAPGAAAEIVFLEGQVTVNGEAAGIGDTVMDGDLIVTGPGSVAELTFGDYRILRAQENSRLSLDSAAGLMTLDAGGLAVLQSKARKLSGKDDWRLQTPTIIASVRGTVYYANVESPDDTYFCLCNGRIHLEDGEGFVDLAAAHHESIRARRSAEGVVYTAAPMQYHDDASIESLADKIHVP
ncbi:MAG: FecR domain-containing protein, partial [Spirochaetales bacterium]|nr:FecR domain-containing protein [Spirochaetales bacterium]